MKQLKISDMSAFDGVKFAARYGLDAERPDFYTIGDVLHFPDHLPDVPEIEPPDKMEKVDEMGDLVELLVAKGVVSRSELPPTLDRRRNQPPGDRA